MEVIKAGTYKFGQLHWENVFQSLSFISNSTSYLAINAFTDAGGFFLNYGQETGFLKGETVYYSLDGNAEWTNTAYTEITLATDQTVSDEFYTWFNAVIEKTLKQSVEQHITDAYTAIGNKSGTIPTQKNLANLAGAINTISAGVDTSDGNIEPTTVLKGYKGYAKGVAVNGAIETYDGSYENLPVVDVVKGDLITIENKQYRVLNVNDTIAEVLAMYDASTSQQFNASRNPVVFTGGDTGQQYQGSDLDTYLNETFFATLSATMQAAIVPKAINQDMWNYSSSVPSSGDYYHNTYGSNNLYYFDNQNGTAYGTAEVGSRNVYALSVKDVIDYLGVSAGGDFADTDIWQMFWNRSTSISEYIWLRSASRGNSYNAFYVNGYNGYLNYTYYNESYRARPAFQIDLSKIAYTKN